MTQLIREPILTAFRRRKKRNSPSREASKVMDVLIFSGTIAISMAAGLWVAATSDAGYERRTGEEQTQTFPGAVTYRGLVLLVAAFTMVPGGIPEHVAAARTRNIRLGQGLNVSGGDCLIAACAITGRGGIKAPFQEWKLLPRFCYRF